MTWVGPGSLVPLMFLSVGGMAGLGGRSMEQKHTMHYATPGLCLAPLVLGVAE